MSGLVQGLGILAGRHVVLLGKGPGEVVDGIEAEHQGDLADGILIFADHLAALLQLHLVDIFLG